MTFRIVEDACEAGSRSATIVVEADGPEQTATTEVKRIVLEKAATLGISRPGISGQGGSYPVDADGNEITLALATGEGDGIQAHGLTPATRYRQDWKVAEGP